MFLRLLALFTLVPLVELILLVRIGEEVGFLATVALVVVTGLLGAALARHQGVRTLTRIRAELALGRLPAESLLDGVVLLVAGALLVTPGLLTDLAGFALLVPAGRRAVRRALGAWLRRKLATRSARVVFVDHPPTPD